MIAARISALKLWVTPRVSPETAGETGAGLPDTAAVADAIACARSCELFCGGVCPFAAVADWDDADGAGDPESVTAVPEARADDAAPPSLGLLDEPVAAFSESGPLTVARTAEAPV